MRWEQRWHPLREEWVIVSAHRQDRPWSGETQAASEPEPPAYDPRCYLCPGNERSGGARNPQYRSTLVFDNDHPCVALDAPAASDPPSPVYRSSRANGIARVVCFSPLHNLTLAEMPREGIEEVFLAWQKEYRDLGGRAEIRHVLMFENKGRAVGVSNPHPHGQIYATNFAFRTIANEAEVSARHLRETGRILFQDILEAETKDGRRILYQNETAVAVLPYFARYAYEVFVAPLETHPSIADLSAAELADLADALQHVLVKLDNLWQMSFPYVMPLHQAPTDGGDYRGFHFHFELHPPLRKPNLRKHLAGPEIGGGNFLSDTVPEEKAAELKALPAVHYKRR
jgi:UDPglucose--hexose-1-phosphate uridylyltransferase